MSKIDRPLSAVERWYWFADRFSPLNVVGRIRVKGDLTIEALRRGLDELQACHPLLRTRIESQEGGVDPRWSDSSAPIALREVPRKGDDHWIDEINERELVDRIDTDVGPLIRTVALIGADGVHDLLVVAPHIIADGTTILSLGEQWLNFSTQGRAESAKARVLPAAEDMRPERYTGASIAASLAEQTEDDRAIVETHRPGRVEPSCVVAFESRKTQLIHRELSGEQVDRMAEAARRNGTTVHGVLTAALLLAAAKDAGDGSSHFAVGSPVNLRGELDPPVQPDEVGTYVATIPTIVQVQAPFWDVARSLIGDLTKRRQRGDHFNLMELIVGAIPESLEAARAFMKTMEAEGPINLCSSNIGRHPFPDRIGNLEISDAQFIAGISVLGYVVATINSSHGRLFWNFTYIADAIPAERALKLVDTCVALALDETEAETARLEGAGS